MPLKARGSIRSWNICHEASVEYLFKPVLSIRAEDALIGDGFSKFEVQGRVYKTSDWVLEKAEA